MQELGPLTEMDQKTGKNAQTVNYIHLSQRDMERFKQNPYFEGGYMEKIKKGVITIIKEAKSKGEKERYNHLNAELQRRGRRNKKAFLSDQCKEIEENNRMRKTRDIFGEGHGTPLQYSCLENPMDRGAWQAAVHGVAKSRTRLRDFTSTFHFHALEKEMVTHSSVLAWRIPGTGEPGGLPSMGSHKVGHN